MNASFEFTRQAAEDLDSIWRYIAEDNTDAADQVEVEILATCRRLAKHPLMGNKRQDITPRPVRFWTVMKICDRLSARNRPASGDRRPEREAGSERGSGKAVPMNS